MGLSDGSVQSLDRALAILEEVAYSHKEIGVTELSKLVGLHKSTVYRLLNTLALRGYIEKNQETECYKIGFKILELGGYITGAHKFRDARPCLEKLMDQTDETVLLAIRNGNKGLYIDKVNCPRFGKMFPNIGSSFTLDSLIIGKVLLSGLEEEELKNLLNEGSSKSFIDNNSALTGLTTELEKIKREGLAVEYRQNEQDIRSIAAPIINSKGRIIAALSVSAPFVKCPEPELALKINLVKESAGIISKMFGYCENGDSIYYC
jgi:IclR family KDG regulon transcriptional repressor